NVADTLSAHLYQVLLNSTSICIPRWPSPVESDRSARSYNCNTVSRPGTTPSHPPRALLPAPGVTSFSFGSQQNLNCSQIFYTPLAATAAQLTKRRSRTLFTRPSIKNVDSVFEPPALIRGRGMPVTGILPTTIPTFTNK